MFGMGLEEGEAEELGAGDTTRSGHGTGKGLRGLADETLWMGPSAAECRMRL